MNCHHPRRRHVQQMPPKYCPIQHSVTEQDCDYIVPVVHPSHTTNVVNHNYKYVHSYPHTESTVNRITSQQFAAGPRPQVAGVATPRPPVAGYGPGPGQQVAGAATPGPGHQVAGYGPNAGPQVGGYGGPGCGR